MKQFLKQSFYTLAGLPLVNHVWKPWRGRACLLCYHRVMPDESIENGYDPNSNLIMPASRFTEQLEYLAKYHDIVSMDELLEHLEGDSNRFVVGVTVDDGYQDNLTHVLPILERFQIPATIYITTRFPEGDTWMWWYEIWDHLKKIKFLDLNEAKIKSKWETRTKRQKAQCYKELISWVMTLSFNNQKKAVEKITQNQCRKQYPHLCLNWDEIKILDQHPLVTIGAHTHSHPNLKQLTEEWALSEMSSSKALLEQKLGHPLEHFAYPFGSANEADTREFELAFRCGFRTAVTTRSETIRTPSLHAIPRLGVPPYLTLQGFKGKLSGWEHLVRKMFF